jgi:hypothetical protein
MAERKYTKAERDEWQRRRMRDEIATGRLKPNANIKAFLEGKPQPPREKRPDAFGTLNQELDRALQAAIRQAAIKHKQVRGGFMVATQDSECFDELLYSAQDGGVYATFANATRGTWFYPMSRAAAKEWFEADGLGEFFNAAIR